LSFLDGKTVNEIAKGNAETTVINPNNASIVDPEHATMTADPP
jgi:hypothetical protein